MSDEALQTMVEAALAAREAAHAPYSSYLVGAALRATDGQVFTGCNIENRSYGLTICAERAAICSAITAGARSFNLLVLALSGAQPPCGACLQVLSEFCDVLPIIAVDAAQDDHPRVNYQLEQLLPTRFELN